MCVLSGIDGSTCSLTRAGIQTIWFTWSKNIATLTFTQADRTITGITMATIGGDITDPTFKQYDFQPNTAFMQQVFSKTGRSFNYAQTLQFNEEGMDLTIRNELEALYECCEVVAIVRDNKGNFWVPGVSYDRVADDYWYERLEVTAGDANTGQNPASDQNLITTTLTCNTICFTPQWTLGSGGIPV